MRSGDPGVSATAVLGLIVGLLAGCAVAPAASPPPPPTTVVAAPASSPSMRPTPTPSRTTTSPGPMATVAIAPVDTRKGAQLDTPFTVNEVIVVSKTHPISARYVPRRTSPNGLTAKAQEALSRMTAAAKVAGVRVVVRSGYRSYATQAGILQRKIREYGSETLARRYNAVAGRSEHQTGLAADLTDGVSAGVARIQASRTGKWLWANSWRFGFILRYPPGKEKITGYAYEPWHFRFVGTQVSKNFGANSTKSLEEYLGIR